MPDQEKILTTLWHHQRKVTDLLDEAETGLKLGGDNRAATMAAIRWRLVRVLRGYQLFKHLMVFDPIIDSGDASRAAAAAAMKTRCLAASESYERHVRKWTLDGVDNWQGYHADKSIVIDRIRKHLIREAQEARTVLTW